jgi:hypothetical protein
MKFKLLSCLSFLIIVIILLGSCSKTQKREETATDEVVQVNSDTITSNESEQVPNSSDSQNWDKMLDDYEDYVDSYIKLYRKAKNGDQTALSEYPELMEKANSLQQSMAQAQNDNQLSVQQITRLSAIQNKMVQAMTK